MVLVSCASLHSHGAFLASKCDSNTIIEEILGKQTEFEDESLVSEVNSLLNEEDQISIDQARVSRQKDISHAVDVNIAKNLLNSAENVREKARLNSVGIQHAGDWLNAVPVKALV